MTTKPIPYRFPRPADAEGWQRDVNLALQTGTLAITPAGGAREDYILGGTCPRCGHEMEPQPFELDVLVPDMLGERRTSAVATIDVEVVCSCRATHKDGVRGCGFGKGLLIAIARPTASPADAEGRHAGD